MCSYTRRFLLLGSSSSDSYLVFLRRLSPDPRPQCRRKTSTLPRVFSLVRDWCSLGVSTFGWSLPIFLEVTLGLFLLVIISRDTDGTQFIRYGQEPEKEEVSGCVTSWIEICSPTPPDKGLFPMSSFPFLVYSREGWWRGFGVRVYRDLTVLFYSDQRIRSS